MDFSKSKPLKTSENKYSKFLTDIEKINCVEKKINHFYKNEFEEVFTDILILTEQQFLDQIIRGVTLVLEDTYSDACLSNNKICSYIEKGLKKVQNDYKTYYDILSKAWTQQEKKVSKRKNSELLYIKYRKHCEGCDDYATHNCGKDSKFLTIKDENDNIKYVICISCKKVYFSHFILCRCYKCKIDFYSNILDDDEDPNLLPATWDNYHCQQIINEKMKCIKCRETFYINLKNGILTCLNKKCGFISRPSRILWTCTICKEEFKSNSIPYNPLDLIVIKKVVRQTLLLKHRAHPNKMPCCKLNVFFTDFYHKKGCKGILYVGELNNNLIIVCDKCHAINFFERFIWTCPQCGKKFRDRKNTIRDEKENINENNNDNNNENEKNIDVNYHKTIENFNSSININNNRNSDKNFKIRNSLKAAIESPQNKRKKESARNTDVNIPFYLLNNKSKKEMNIGLPKEKYINQKNQIKNQRTNYLTKYGEKKEKEQNEQKDNEPRPIFRRHIGIRSNMKSRQKNAENEKIHKDDYSSEGGNNSARNNSLINKINTVNNDNNGPDDLKDSKLNNLKFRRYLYNKYASLSKNEKSNIGINEVVDDDEDDRILSEEGEEEDEEENKNNSHDKNIKLVFRIPEGHKTKGHEIKDEKENEPIKRAQNFSEFSAISNKSNNIDYSEVPMSSIAGLSEHLMNRINKRMNFILSRCKIPIINIDDYIMDKKLGEGSYGVIFSVFNRKDNKSYALKKIIAHTLEEIDGFTKEFELVHSCEHDNIMKIYGITSKVLDATTYALYVLMELSKGDWEKAIRIRLEQRRYYTENELINILFQLTNALLFMQEKFQISHRDIKPQNILLFDGGTYKLADFGEAKEVKINKQLNSLRGTELYMSPALYEGLKNEKDDVSHNPFKSDVFSLGFCFLFASALNYKLLYELRDVHDSRKMNMILHKNLRKLYSEKYIGVLSHMLEIDENKRFDFRLLYNEIKENYRRVIK